MLDILRKHIEQNLSLLKGKQLLIACSGGLDSVFLARTFHELEFRIGLAHCNFGLRDKESDADAEFVADLAEMLSVPFYEEFFQTEEYAKSRKLSIQMAARELRYAWFEEIRKDFGYDYILTAHHADDRLETFLINLSRGSGLRGLSGIPEISGFVVRPLLPFGREELFNHAREQRYHWREDSSNSKMEYLRNAIRQEVVPPMKKHLKGLINQFANTQNHLRESQALVEDYMVLIRQLVLKESDDGHILDIKKLNELPNPKALLYELLYPFGFTAWEDISDLLLAQSGKTVLSATHRLVKDRGSLLLTEIPSENETETIEIGERIERIDHPIELIFSSEEKVENSSTSEIYVDKSKLAYPLSVRKWRDGDYFYPFGMKGKKKLSKFFKDEKLSLVAKEKTWLLCSGDDIVWVIGYRADDRYKVDRDTKEIIRIRTSKSTG